MAGIFWWVIFPYIALTIMILGLLYRFTFRQLTWAAPSTNFLEKKWLRIGSPLFHYGIIFAFIGHVMGMVIPMEFYQRIGISDHLYHIGAMWGGGIAGLMVVVGLVILLIRKITIDPVRIKATFADFFSVLALLFVAGTGTYMSIIYNTTVVAYEYRATIGPWFRSLFVFMPKYELMIGIPWILKIHVASAFAFFATIPFTRLVHIFSFPIRYPARSPQQYRSRDNYRGQHN
ncbi:respiratory nitrate reductase subunit gamma [Oceanobacillus caeni]|uniref:respiratory nitrate reductase subunit gamma n=1 Tax=Oceanobacillus caeni TaxID=405946 RepID=UPI001958FB9D|nr:respiratory nitrate reductase subunit gamma [Oceanobacillus caeni]MCR1835089.1 respiratory nitrate reductase subunit gamma [Oceanobacillus caeni]